MLDVAHLLHFSEPTVLNLHGKNSLLSPLLLVLRTALPTSFVVTVIGGNKKISKETERKQKFL